MLFFCWADSREKAPNKHKHSGTDRQPQTLPHPQGTDDYQPTLITNRHTGMCTISSGTLRGMCASRG